jgi:hypothetical protein
MTVSDCALDFDGQKQEVNSCKIWHVVQSMEVRPDQPETPEIANLFLTDVSEHEEDNHST